MTRVDRIDPVTGRSESCTKTRYPVTPESRMMRLLIRKGLHYVSNRIQQCGR